MNTIFISGWALGAEPMRSLAEAFGRTTAGIFSLEELGGDALTPPDYARSILDRLDSREEPTLLVGWSAGGVVALEAALRGPEKIGGLILCSSTPRFCAARDFPFGVPERKLAVMEKNFSQTWRKHLQDSWTSRPSHII